MKKLAFLIGVGVGFLLGSKAGSGPYQEIESKVRALVNRPEVRATVESTKEVAQDQITQVMDKAADRLPGSDDQERPFPNSDGQAGRSRRPTERP